MKTGPWMHNGKSTSMEEIIEKLNSADLITNNNPLIRPLSLSKKEKNDLLAFLKAISVSPVEFKKPVLPK